MTRYAILQGVIHYLEGDCRQVLPTLPAQSVNCSVTSPPYFGLRSYLKDDDPRKHLELGNERSPQEYLENLVAVFRQVYRVLADNGTFWLNIGDAFAKKKVRDWNVKPGALLGLPWRLVLHLQLEDWYLRSDIIWHATNKMPESVKTRPSRSHEYLFLFTKGKHYFYDVDAIREPCTSKGGGASFGKQKHDVTGTRAQSRRLRSAAERSHPLGRNKRSVWSIPTKSFHGAHFAVMPPELVRPCIRAGCPQGGVVLDPFAGSGTTAIVAEQEGRNAILIELNPAYIILQQQHLAVRSVLEGEKPALPPPLLPTEPVRKACQQLLWDE